MHLFVEGAGHCRRRVVSVYTVTRGVCHRDSCILAARGDKA